MKNIIKKFIEGFIWGVQKVTGKTLTENQTLNILGAIALGILVILILIIVIQFIKNLKLKKAILNNNIQVITKTKGTKTKKVIKTKAYLQNPKHLNKITKTPKGKKGVINTKED